MTITVGRSVSKAEAKRIVTRYTRSPDAAYEYPAYDGYAGGGTSHVTGPDLLAPILLNVRHLSLTTYYALLDCADEMNGLLDQLTASPSLDQATPAQIEPVVALFGMLDTHNLPGVQLTVLSKVLHRKRPDLIPLYDQNIRRCYLTGAPPRLASVRGRNWSDFARAWLPIVQRDLASQLDDWERLASLARVDVPLTPLRALDIVGWTLGQPSDS